MAWAVAQQRRDARGRVCGVPPPLERHAVCVLHSCGSPRVHSGVSVAEHKHAHASSHLIFTNTPSSCPPGSALETASTGQAA